MQVSEEIAAVLFRQIALAEDDAAGLQLQRLLHHVLLLAAQDDGALPHAAQGLAGGGQRDGHLAGNAVEQVLLAVEHVALQRGKHVENRRVLHHGRLDGLHIAFGHAPGGDHAEKGVVLMGHRQGAEVGMLLHQLPGVAHRNADAQAGRTVKIHVPDLRADGGNLPRGGEPEFPQQEAGFIVHGPEPDGNIVVFTQHIAQSRVGNGGDDGIRIRIAMAADIGGLLHRRKVLS